MPSAPEHPKSAASMQDIEKLVALSRRYGADTEFVIAGGGNTSVKTGDVIHVKASGRSMAGIDETGFVALARGALRALLEREGDDDPVRREADFKEAVLAARLEPEKEQRPSVECVLHNVIPEKFVVHSHSTWANMIACSTEAETTTRELFGDDVLLVPYVDPGYVLARTLASALDDYTARTGRASPTAVLMRNHGLIVAGDSPEEVVARTDSIVGTIRREVEETPGGEPFGATAAFDAPQAQRLIETIAPALRALLSTCAALKVVTFDDSPTVLSLAGARSGMALAEKGPLTPDQVVYCKALPLCFAAVGDETPEQLVEKLRGRIDEYKAARGFPPQVVLVERLGLLAAGDDFAAADITRLVYVDAIKITAGAEKLGGVSFLSERERDFIENWEVESYRRNVAAAGRAAGRAAGKVAVVTGAAQGFGLGIARDLVAEGAHVALTDVNEEGARRAAADLEADAACGRATGLPLDVTDAASIAAAIHQVLRKYGGFDVFVSNAGVLKAGSVKRQAPADFDFVTRVNYRGYFLCVQKAAPVLAMQHLARSDYSSDIIQINSKSGLRGSNRNSAYAGGKFGAIGLTESFAMELVEDGIKVNSICPGNFFDGPLWSDPENGLFVQYLQSGKVPGARTVEDVRRAYEAKVPMCRGCTVADLMKAVYYCIEQQYETGQAIPVTGGQVMLR